MTTISNAVKLASDLIKCASVTPIDAGAMDVLQARLEALGFVCTRYPFGEGVDRVDNLYARFGTSAPNFCFAGKVHEGELWGRGAADMKGAIAAFVSAVETLMKGGWSPKGSISFLITGDEEGPAINGTDKLLQAIIKAGEKIDHCLVGEPTNPNVLGTMIKNGRRGSLNAKIDVIGTEGHVAYPHLASNPVPVMLTLLSNLLARTLDEGNAFFQPSNLEVTAINVTNRAHNVIPEIAKAQFNIRFNTEHKGDDLKAWIRGVVADVQAEFDGEIKADLRVTGEAFLTEPNEFTSLVQDVVGDVTGQKPELSTSGGTSDARYITHYAPVIEFGLVGATMHKVNERVAIRDIDTLTQIYEQILTRYFS